MQLCEPKLCTGCTACAAACPGDCIVMERDREGFLRPVIDGSRCTECGLCAKACPVLNAPQKAGGLPAAFGAKNKDEPTRALSASGGVFTLLAEEILARGGVVFGAAFDMEFRVHHKPAVTTTELVSLRGAKYAQSDMDGIFRQVKEQLQQGKQVLFSGTPCQVAGLRAYLGREEPNLWLVDVVCHGVTSPAVWERYLAQKSEQICQGQRPVTVNLRSKGSRQGLEVEIRWPYSRSYTASHREDPYVRAFNCGLCLRPSCHRCSFNGLTHPADFTLGGLRTSNEETIAVDSTAVLVHTAKAKELWDKLSQTLSVQTVDVRRCMEHNPAAMQSAACDAEMRESFLHRFEDEDMAALADELLPRIDNRESGLAGRLMGFFRKK